MLYSVFVKPRSKKGPLVIESQTGQRELIVYLREKPVDGKANEALIKILAQYFRLPKSAIRIKSGAQGRRKIVEILDANS